MTLDETDRQILRCLEQDARMQWKDIGQQVHLTGQAVAARIRKLEELGIIEGFTVKINKAKIDPLLTALVTVFMKTTDHQYFQQFLAGKEAVKEAHRVSGEGCYSLQVQVVSQEQLNEFLDEILKFGNYRVNLSIRKVK